MILRPKGLELFNNFMTFSNLAVRFKRSLGMPGPEKLFIDKIN